MFLADFGRCVFPFKLSSSIKKAVPATMPPIFSISLQAAQIVTERAVSDHQWPPAGKEVHNRQHQPDAGGHRTTVFRTDRLPDRGRVSASALCGRGHPGLKKEAGPVRLLPYKHV